MIRTALEEMGMKHLIGARRECLVPAPTLEEQREARRGYQRNMRPAMTKHTGAPAKPEQRNAKPKAIRSDASAAGRDKSHDKAASAGKPFKGKPQTAKSGANRPSTGTSAGRKAPRVAKGK